VSRRGLLLLAASAALLLPVPSSAAAAPHTYTIVLDKMKFGAVPPSLHVGDTIVWVNRDIFRHTATAKTGGFDVDLPAKASAKTVLKKAGAIAVTCKFHPGMRATLKVAPR